MRRKKSLVTFYLNPKIHFLIIASALTILIGFILSDIFFRIKHVIVSGVPLNSRLKGLELTANMNLLFFDTNGLSRELKRDNPAIDTISIQKNYPQTLSLSITFSQPLAVFASDNGYFLLDKNAKILQKLPQLPAFNDLPILYYYQKLAYTTYQTGDFIDYQDIKAGLYFSRVTTLAQIPIAYVDIASNDMIVCYLRGPKGGQIVFSQKVDPNIQTYALQTIIRQLKIEGKNYQKIDLRFDKPVITF